MYIGTWIKCQAKNKTFSASSPALNGWETFIPFRWDCQVDKSKKTVDKKTPTAKKGTNLAVGLSRTKVQETFNLNLDCTRRRHIRRRHILETNDLETVANHTAVAVPRCTDI